MSTFSMDTLVPKCVQFARLHSNQKTKRFPDPGRWVGQMWPVPPPERLMSSGDALRGKAVEAQYHPSAQRLMDVRRRNERESPQRLEPW